MVMQAEIHFHELKSWQARHNAGEIYMTGLAPTKNGYRLTYTETPGMPPLNNLSGCRVEERHVQVATDSQCAHRAVEADETARTASVKLATPTILPILVHCEDCNTDHPEGQDCPICAPLARIAVKAREKRLAWHLFKTGKGPRP